MNFSAADYVEQIKALLPRGELWTSLASDLVVLGWIRGTAEEFARIDARALQLIDETDPRTTIELLEEWEAFAGLPDECVGAVGTLQERRSALLVKLTNRGGQSRQFYIDLAASLGFTVEIIETLPFKASVNRVGQPLLGSEQYLSFTVNGEQETPVWFRAGQSTAGENLKLVGNTILECIINKFKPAHDTVFFTYTL